MVGTIQMDGCNPKMPYCTRWLGVGSYHAVMAYRASPLLEGPMLYSELVCILVTDEIKQISDVTKFDHEWYAVSIIRSLLQSTSVR